MSAGRTDTQSDSLSSLRSHRKQDYNAAQHTVVLQNTSKLQIKFKKHFFDFSRSKFSDRLSDVFSSRLRDGVTGMGRTETPVTATRGYPPMGITPNFQLAILLRFSVIIFHAFMEHP